MASFLTNMLKRGVEFAFRCIPLRDIMIDVQLLKSSLATAIMRLPAAFPIYSFINSDKKSCLTSQFPIYG